MTDFLSAALEYAGLGFKVFPCAPGKKHPITENGLLDATTDESLIDAWWTAHPNANIGLVTDGLLVVDVDGADNAWLADQPERRIDLACAPLQITPRGGRHYVFQSHHGYRNTAGYLAPNVDTRTNGGYILVSPSVVDGKAYQWATGHALDSQPHELPSLPMWLIWMLEDRTHQAKKEFREGSNKIPNGQRHHALVSMAGAMRRVGMSESEILAALTKVSEERFIEPGDPVKTAAIARRVAGYAPDQIAVAVAEDHWGQMIEKSPGSVGPVLLCMENVEPKEVSWLWPGRMAAGRLTLLVGRPGLGKSFLTCDMASRVSTGTDWPDGHKCQQGSVILVTAEDDPHDTIRPRLDAHGADVSKIHLLSAVNRLDVKTGEISEVSFTLEDAKELEAGLKRLPDCRLIIIDPIGSFLGGDVDSNQDNKVRGILTPVARLAEKYGCAVLIVAHNKKGAGSIHADDLALGSRAFTGICRSVWHLWPDASIETRRLFLPGKNNLAMRQPGLAFSIVGDPIGRLEWEPDPVDMTADDRLGEEHGLQEKRNGQKPEKTILAMEWLKDALANGPRLVKELTEEAVEVHGISKRTLDTARAKLGVKPYRPEIPGPWWVTLPASFSDESSKQPLDCNVDA